MAKKVFVSGCYDMLHSGHIAFFEEAASYGDLYVGLGSDQTIWGLKARKPINSNAERLYMVKAIKYVKDAWINSGSGIMDFEKEVLELQPDIFFVNTDGYTPAKQEFCKKHNNRHVPGMWLNRRLCHRRQNRSVLSPQEDAPPLPFQILFDQITQKVTCNEQTKESSHFAAMAENGWHQYGRSALCLGAFCPLRRYPDPQ